MLDEASGHEPDHRVDLVDLVPLGDDVSSEGTEQDQRLADILDEYLQQIELGRPVCVDELAARYPDLAEPIREFLDGFDVLQAGIFELASADVAQALPASPVGECRRLGDYEIVREVGRGGMGVVYEAQQVSLDRRVALKVLPFAAMLDKRQIIRFENEARAAAQLHHSHIVPVHGVGCHQGVHFYAMQFIEGESVRELIDVRREAQAAATSPGFSDALTGSEPSGSRRQIDAIARLGVQAASALHAAHQCGVVHRDIKPSNLMLDSEGDVWVTDFGLASCQTENHVTQAGDVIGTLHYMSPEQARGETNVADPRSDVYSLGVTLYELLTLQRPFEGDTAAEVIRQIEIGSCPSIRQRNARVPRDLQNVVAKAMAPLPSERYPSAEALEEDLQRFVDGKATHAKPPSRVRLFSRWAARNRSVVVSAIAAFGVICATLFVATFWLAAERAELTVERDEVSRQLAKTESTFEEFGLATAERLKQTPGSESVRRALLEELLAHYQTLLASSSSTSEEMMDIPSLRVDRAVTSTKIANVHRQTGDLPAAVAAYRVAQADFRMLSDQARLAECLSSASVILFELGEFDDAVAEVAEAIRIQRSLIKDPQTNDTLDESPRSVAVGLATSYANLGRIQFERDPAAAEAALAKATELGKQAYRGATGKRGRIDALQVLATVYSSRSSLAGKSDVAAAMQFGEFAVRSNRVLAKIGRDQKRFQSMLANSCNNLATHYVQQSRADRAIALFREATVALRVAGDDVALVGTLSNLAKVQIQNGLAAKAIATYREAISLQSALLRSSPANLNHVSRLGGLYNNLAFVRQSDGKTFEACVAFESAIEYQRRAFELAPPTVVSYRDALSRTYFNASRAQRTIGRPFQAAELQRLRGELWPSDAMQLFSVANHLAKIVREVPETDSRRRNVRTLAAAMLKRSIAVDHENAVDRDNADQLAHFLAVDVADSAREQAVVAAMVDGGSQP